MSKLILIISLIFSMTTLATEYQCRFDLISKTTYNDSIVLETKDKKECDKEAYDLLMKNKEIYSHALIHKQGGGLQMIDKDNKITIVK